MSDDERDEDLDLDDAENETGDTPGKIEDKLLDAETLAGGLSVLSRSGNGLEHSFVRLDVAKQELTDISAVSKCIHLRYINAADNHLTDLSPLNSIPDLCSLDVSGNKLEELALEPRPYLQIADVSANSLSNCSTFEQPMLQKLNLSGNQISDPGDLKQSLLPVLSELELKNNGIMSIDTISLPSLTILHLDGNNLERLVGIGALVSLVRLSCKGNQIKSLDGFTSEQRKLSHIDCSENAVASLLEVAKLGVLPNLKTLTFIENAVAEDPEYRAETLISIGQLEQLDGEPFEEEERGEASTKREQRAAEAKEREAQARRDAGLTEDIAADRKSVV